MRSLCGAVPFLADNSPWLQNLIRLIGLASFGTSKPFSRAGARRAGEGGISWASSLPGAACPGSRLHLKCGRSSRCPWLPLDGCGCGQGCFFGEPALESHLWESGRGVYQ